MEDQNNKDIKSLEEKDRIILGIETRIKSEYIKHGKNINDWAKIAAHKIYASYNIKIKDNGSI